MPADGCLGHGVTAWGRADWWQDEARAWLVWDCEPATWWLAARRLEWWLGLAAAWWWDLWAFCLGTVRWAHFAPGGCLDLRVTCAGGRYGLRAGQEGPNGESRQKPNKINELEGDVVGSEAWRY